MCVHLLPAVSRRSGAITLFKGLLILCEVASRTTSTMAATAYCSVHDITMRALPNSCDQSDGSSDNGEAIDYEQFSQRYSASFDLDELVRVPEAAVTLQGRRHKDYD